MRSASAMSHLALPENQHQIHHAGGGAINFSGHPPARQVRSGRLPVKKCARTFNHPARVPLCNATHNSRHCRVGKSRRQSGSNMPVFCPLCPASRPRDLRRGSRTVRTGACSACGEVCKRTATKSRPSCASPITPSGFAPDTIRPDSFDAACQSSVPAFRLAAALLRPASSRPKKHASSPLIFRRIELFIRRLPRLFQLLTVILVDFLQTTLNHLPHMLQACFIAPAFLLVA